jgi:hypothetical protein
VRRRPALLVLLAVLFLALVAALAGAGSLGPGALTALLTMIGAPGLAPILAAAALAGAGALAGAVGSLLAGPRAVDALAAGVVGLLEGAAAAGADPPDGRGHRSPTS